VEIANKQVRMAMNQHATIEEMLEAVFSVVCAAAVAMQQRNKYVSAATVELQQYSCVFYMVCAKGL
jgi:hypothetical protein